MTTVVAKEHLYKVLRAPKMTEKSTFLAEKLKQIVFEVAVEANKLQVKKAVEAIFNVEVLQVRIVNVKGKRRLFRQIRGKCNDYKKAYVQLKEGHDINFVDKE